jgi:hypothetical protein
LLRRKVQEETYARFDRCLGVSVKVVRLFVLVALLVPFVVAQDKQFVDDWQKKANSQGAGLDLKEVGRERVEGHTVVTYRLFASGLPKERHYTLWSWNLGSAPQAIADAFINEQGLIMNQLANAAQGVSEDPINAKVFAGRGERKRFAITSDDWTLQAFAEAVPFPLEQTSGTCRLSVVMAAPDYAGVVLRGSGFKSNARLSIEVTSGTEVGKQQVTATADGTYVAAIVGTVKGQRSGKTTVTVISPDCRVGVQFPWGEGSYRTE